MTGLTKASQGGEAVSRRESAGTVENVSSSESRLQLRWNLSHVASRVAYVAVAVGIVLRALHFLANRSLSQDEAMLALNVVHRSFSGLLHQLDFLQGAPLGFLTLQKISVEGLGNDEYSLRLVSFLAGTTAVVLIAVIARDIVVAWAVPIVAAVFALSDPLITWTVWAKPYAVDVLAAVVLTWMGIRLARSTERSWLIGFALLAAAAIWFSYPSVFVLAGISSVLVGAALLRRQWRRSVLLSLASAPWIASFTVFAFTMLHNLEDLQRLSCLNCVRQGLSGSGSSSGWQTLRGSWGEFRYVSGMPHVLEQGGADVGLVLFAIALAFCAVGFRSLAARQLAAAAILVAPLGFMLIAWGLGDYPVLGRTQLFLVPSFVLLLGEGVVFAVMRARAGAVRAVSAACAFVVVVALGVPAFIHLVERQRFEDMKPVLAYLGRNERASDTLYIFYTGQYQVRYYLECHCAGKTFEQAQRVRPWPKRDGPGGPDEFAPALLSVPPRLIIPIYHGRDPSAYVSGLDALRGRKRVWFLLSSLEDNRREFLLRELNRRGTQQAALKVGSGKEAVAVYLYALRKAEP